MASLQELRKRLKSIRSTEQLASAMRTAATAKYSRLGGVRGAFSPYAAARRELLRMLGGAGIAREGTKIVPRDCVVVMSGNRGLCGGFNAELNRFLDEQLPALRDPLLLVCGKKAASHLRERGAAFEEYPVSDVPDYAEVLPVSERVRALYTAGEVERVYVICQSFVNMLTQTPVCLQLLPEGDAEGGAALDGDRTLYLPDRETVAAYLAVKCLDVYVFELAMENAVGAQAATMMAMRSACDSAEESAANLEVTINRRRQADVTSSVIETASGSFASEE